MTSSADSRLLPRLLQLLPLVFGGLVLIVGFCANDFEYDTDEGINLMKSLLLSRGHHLYSEIWSDQPPAFTYALVGWFKAFGMSVLSARTLVLLVSVLLLVALQQTLRILETSRQAWVAVLLLAGSNWYALLSFSVMIGLPALGVAMAAVWIAAVFRKCGGWWVALLAGAVMGVSVQTKAFTLLLLPMLLILLLAPLGEALDRLPLRRRLIGTAAFVVGLAAAFALIGLATGTDLMQLTQTHLRASELNPDTTTVSPVLTLMRRDWMLAILASTSILLINRRDAWRHLLPFVWFASAAVVLHNHWPVWRHHGMLLMIPASWAAARMVCWLWDRARVHVTSASRHWSRLAAGLVIVWGTYTGVRAMVRLVEGESGAGPRMTALLAAHEDSTLVYADRLMPAFRARLSVPPPLAVVSIKRQRAGELSDAALVQILQDHQPDQLLLGRLTYGPAFYAYVDRHYTLAYRSRPNVGPEVRHYLLNPPPATQPAVVAK